MNLFSDIRNYIGENNFKIIIYKDEIDIINYNTIDEITNNKIIVFAEKQIIIEGKNLKVKKLENEEILVLGNITSINFNE